jgi:hypothetical protein
MKALYHTLASFMGRTYFKTLDDWKISRRRSQTRMMGTEMVPEMLVNFNHLTWLMA